MHKKIKTLGETEVEKHQFHKHKKPISLYDVDINKVLVSNKVSFGERGFKHFIGYKDGKRDCYV